MYMYLFTLHTVFYYLISDFAGEPWSSVGCSDNAVGFALNNMPESVVTIITSKSSPRYRAQSESISAMCLIISVLVSRIESHHASKQKQVQITFQASALPLPTLLSAVDKHASLRNQLNVLQVTLFSFTTPDPPPTYTFTYTF